MSLEFCSYICTSCLWLNLLSHSITSHASSFSCTRPILNPFPLLLFACRPLEGESQCEEEGDRRRDAQGTTDVKNYNLGVQFCRGPNFKLKRGLVSPTT
jgi:hypothetical protein